MTYEDRTFHQWLELLVDGLNSHTSSTAPEATELFLLLRDEDREFLKSRLGPGRFKSLEDDYIRGEFFQRRQIEMAGRAPLKDLDKEVNIKDWEDLGESDELSLPGLSNPLSPFSKGDAYGLLEGLQNAGLIGYELLEVGLKSLAFANELNNSPVSSPTF